ncbi:hypothetical protein NT6N_24750 [Oceaniferula spumae]|uniref:Uncharacterized protein n=1 Tax=Oceaniferula spumae TaxID=2979115 RepID=A0AAT9FN44_9BACT
MDRRAAGVANDRLEYLEGSKCESTYIIRALTASISNTEKMYITSITIIVRDDMSIAGLYYITERRGLPPRVEQPQAM